MVAITYAEVKDSDDPAYRHVDYRAKIHDSVRLEPFSIIEEGVVIGEETLIGPFNHIRPFTTIGKNCRIGGHNTFEGHCSIGDRVRMGSHNNIGWECHVGDEVFIGGHFTGANDKSMIWPLPPGEIFEPTGYMILDGAKIGLGVVLAPGITVGYKAFVEIGSVVTRSVGRYERWGPHFAEKKGELKAI